MNRLRSVTAVIALSALAALATGVVGASASGSSVATADAPTATSSVSANWAGYIASGTDAQTLGATTFSHVSGSWVEPKADCTAATITGSTSSAFWVGLGGNASGSHALEQTGTEVDCSASGAANYFAWYELVPAGSVQLHLTIKPGDHISASVGVEGTKVTIALHDLTRGTGFAKTLHMSAPDTTSAEWIAEAPSVCASSVDCQQQALTDFGTVKFTGANAVSSTGTASGITSSAWSETAVSLESSSGGGFYGGGFGRHFGGEVAASEAVPTGLTDGGAAFSITWKSVSDQQPGGGYGGYGGGYGYGGGGYGGGGYGY